MFLSFLPASHAYEHSGGQMFPIALGSGDRLFGDGPGPLDPRPGA